MSGHEVLRASQRDPERLRDSVDDPERASLPRGDPVVGVEVPYELNPGLRSLGFQEGRSGQQRCEPLKLARLGKVSRQVCEHEPI